MAQQVASAAHVQAPYVAQHKIRIVTAASLFDGHDAAINIMRRILQASGAEVIHLGHNRSVGEIVNAAIQEDAQAVAITSYQGGHVEYFKYMFDLLRERGAGHIKIFGGGGGTILPTEIEELHNYGISRIYSPDDGRAMGLQGMINDLLQKADFLPYGSPNGEAKKLRDKDPRIVARAISFVENETEGVDEFLNQIKNERTGKRVPVLGITGTGGAGKSSLTDELVRRFLLDFADKKVAILSVDPSKRKTGGALLGDRIRMNSIDNSRVFMRSFATREANVSISRHIQDALEVVKAAEFDLIIVETAGIGQSDSQITEVSDACLYVMTPEFGAATQLEKIDMLDFADIVAINKFDKRGALDALRDVRKTIQRSQQRWSESVDTMPAYGTMASQFNDPGTHRLYRALMDLIESKTNAGLISKFEVTDAMSEKIYIIPPDRTRYLAEIGEEGTRYEKWVKDQVGIARQAWQVKGTIELITDSAHKEYLTSLYTKLWDSLHIECKEILEGWPKKLADYRDEDYVYYVRGKEIRVPNYYESLSHTKIPKVTLPRFEDWGEILRWVLRENVPGEYPYTAGVYPFKRTGEDPTRMFAGEGGPERTNRRFHYVSLGMPAARLSTAFDSVTLYGEDPAVRPDIYGKIGNSGVSIASVNDAKKLYSGFDLCAPTTSVSMTINGPAPMLLAFFLNAAVDQQCEKYIIENGIQDEVNRKIALTFLRRWMMMNTHAKYFNGPNGETVYASERDIQWIEENEKIKLEFTIDCLIPGPSGNGKDDSGFHLYTKDNNIPGLDCTPTIWRNSYLLPKFLVDFIPSYWGELPEGNTGLGLMLLGLSGDKVLPPSIYSELKAKALNTVRGTVQADILKEDQAQNTCIFSTEFALRLMGDIQQYFIDQKVRNFYSVSISGYHIAEAGANPITQLAFTLANGFTFVEYYLSRGMDINEFAPNLSFFFSNGMDPEYAVIGRVARRIWAKAMRNKYGANERSQMLKYHIQTSGRSLHAQEIAFNDIRTTLQALYAIYDNCNSLHTNAYDEAITTPTEESVRRAMAIQLIINKELGLAKNENPIQGSFIIEELTDLVEEAVMAEFRRISDRGGVLGAMETMYQRNQIQEESMYYEMQKHTGEYPIVGVNTFLDKNGSPTIIPEEVIRSTTEEKQFQINAIQTLHHYWNPEQREALAHLQRVAVENGNLFEALMEAAKVCSLGQMTNALYAVGGQYRRNM